MNIYRITLYLVKMELKHPFVASNARYSERETIIVEVVNQDGLSGWGEGVAFSTPFYTEETVTTSWHMLKDFLIPLALHKQIDSPIDFHTSTQFIQRNHMAKAALETALWDLYAKEKKESLSHLIGGTRREIDAGVAVGIEPLPQMLKTIEGYVTEGYKRIKVKIKPGQDLDVIKQIRMAFPTIMLMADANSAYTLSDLQSLKELDPYQLLMIEQPLASDDIFDHAVLQKQLQTPVCLDESIISYSSAKKAVELNSCKIINVKLGRVGGITEAKRIHDYCQKQKVPLWCGGMLETGIGRAHNIALASLPQFSLPGDISASSRYWESDIIEPEVHVKDGKITVPSGAGIGYSINEKALKKVTSHREDFYK